MAAPPPFPPSAIPPSTIPPGWRAEWSAEHNTWYYLNLTTQASQWNFPVEQVQAPYGVPSPPQQYPPYAQQQPISPQPLPLQPQPQPQQPAGAQPIAPGQDGERGLGKIAAGGLIGVAGGLLAGAFLNHEKPEIENKIPKPHFSFWNNNDSNQQNGGGPTAWFSTFSSGSGNQNPGDFIKPAEAAMAAGGGLFGSMASHIPHHRPSQHHTSPPAPHHQVVRPPQQQTAPQPIHHTPSYNTGPAPPLHIHCAAWADQDITHLVRQMVTPHQSIDFNTDDLISSFGDPWPNAKKQFSILYSYGSRPWELIATSSGSGRFSLIPHEPLSRDRMAFIQNPNSRGRIVAVVWGTGNGLEGGKGPVEKLKEIEETGELQATVTWFGFDNIWGAGRVAVVYYRAVNGEIKMAAARDGGTCRLPWNPLARWS